MELIVDLHVHSHYSRATSRDCTAEGLYRWGKIKGINIIGTGDFTHPEWFAEMCEKLEPTEDGLYKLKDEIAAAIDRELPPSVRGELIRFVPTVEIATIYSKGGKVRKLHQVVVLPDFKSVSELNARLDRIGNLKADGRPILGLDSKLLLQHALEVNPDGLYIPAHIWTPWFGMFGSKSGFDSIEEAYEDLAPEIKAIETGLSSDPAMNRRVGSLGQSSNSANNATKANDSRQTKTVDQSTLPKLNAEDYKSKEGLVAYKDLKSKGYKVEADFEKQALTDINGKASDVFEPLDPNKAEDRQSVDAFVVGDIVQNGDSVRLTIVQSAN